MTDLLDQASAQRSDGGCTVFAALRTHRDRAMVLAGLRRCEVLGLRLADVQVAGRRLVVVEGKGGHHLVVPEA